MKGYKATNANMTCRNYQFELNTEFVHTGEIKPCESGFHFCHQLQDILHFYGAPDTRIFEIEATGKVITDGIKSVTDKIKLIRELPIEQLYEQCQQHWQIRCMAAHRQYNLDVLINDHDWRVRAQLARQGYGLGVLINDPIYHIRKQVARQGYGLDILIHDRDEEVRAAVKHYKLFEAHFN